MVRAPPPQQGLGQSPIRNRIWCILAVKSGDNNFSDIRRKLFTVFGVIDIVMAYYCTFYGGLSVILEFRCLN